MNVTEEYKAALAAAEISWAFLNEESNKALEACETAEQEMKEELFQEYADADWREMNAWMALDRLEREIKK
jgi:hypothetical protein